MTPTLRFRVAATAARAPGSITPITGTSVEARSVSSATADIVLHATTRSFTPVSRRNFAFSSVYCETTVADLVP